MTQSSQENVPRTDDPIHFDGIREQLRLREEALHVRAAKGSQSHRERPEDPSPIRTEFQRDRDRILHCKSFRRLKHKTQVFISPEGDHFRTRLTHTLEVSQISRTIARALNLNEDLTEAIALGHDLGHTPFGHTGERVIRELTDYPFKHYQQSLRLVEKLEYHGKGLNLCDLVRDGILRHSKGIGPIIPEDRTALPRSLEGQIVRVSDIIAYVNHDLDDAIRAGVIRQSEIPQSTQNSLGTRFAKRIDTIVMDVIRETLSHNLEFIVLSSEIYQELETIRDFLFERVYRTELLEQERSKVKGVLGRILDHLHQHPEPYIAPYPVEDSVERRIIDFVAGMTDRYALKLFNTLTIPHYM
jgi:dGTPase